MNALDNLKTHADYRAFCRDNDWEDDEPTQRPSRRILAYIQQLVTRPDPTDPESLTARELQLYRHGVEVGRRQIMEWFGTEAGQ